MSEIHRFLFEGLPVRGVLVRLSDAWRTILSRRAQSSTHQAYPLAVQNLLGELAAAATLLRANIKFDGTLILQILGDGPVKLAVVEVQPNFGLRATATVVGDVLPDAGADLSALVNANNQGRCVITLAPQVRTQPSYQGVVPLSAGQDGRDDFKKFAKTSDVLQHYMLQSEQLETTLVLAANDQAAAGLLIQRLPQGGGVAWAQDPRFLNDENHADAAYQHIAVLASSLKPEELLRLDAESILRRLFWAENVVRLAPAANEAVPHFSCTCSRERVVHMILGLGAAEADSILAERSHVEVGCEFCGAQYRFDAVDVAQIFHPLEQTSLPSSAATQVQ